MRIIRKLGSAISTLVVVVMVFLAIALVGVRLIGLTPYAVLSGSMEPTYHVGSLIYVKKVEPENVVVGTPITFVVNEDLLLATHRVVAVEKRLTRMEEILDANGQPVLDADGEPTFVEVPLEDPVYYFQTKGDANEAVDGALVHHKNVVGAPKFSIPYLGYLSNWLQTPKGMIMGASIALVLLILTFVPDLLNLVDDEPIQKKNKKPEKKKNKKAKNTDVPDDEEIEPVVRARKAERPVREAPVQSEPSGPGTQDLPEAVIPAAPPAAAQAPMPVVPAIPDIPPAPEMPAEQTPDGAAPRRRRRRQAIEQEIGE